MAPDRELSRRDFLKVSGLGVLGTMVHRISPDEAAVVVKEKPDGNLLKRLILDAARRSSREGVGVVLYLPDGYYPIEESIDVDMGSFKNCNVSLVGRGRCEFALSRRIAEDVTEEWERDPRNNMLSVTGLDGRIAFHGIAFDGGYTERSGKPPLSPSSAVVNISGGESGAGTVYMDGCRFTNSKSVGFFVRSVSKVHGSNIVGENLDAVGAVGWCRDASFYQVIGKRLTSDGIYAQCVERLNIYGGEIVTARQGYTLAGVGEAYLERTRVGDCGIAYNIGAAEADPNVVSGVVVLRNSGSEGCLVPYSIGLVGQLLVSKANHRRVGAWLEQYQSGDWWHGEGIRDPLRLSKEPPIVLYGKTGNEGRVVAMDDVRLGVLYRNYSEKWERYWRGKGVDIDEELQQDVLDGKRG